MKGIFHRFFTIVLVVCSILLLVDVAKACSCFESSLDSAIEESKNIAIMKMTSFEKYQEGEKGYGYKGIKQVKFVIQEVFKGNFKKGQEINFIQGDGGDCRFAFIEEAVGIEMLYFLSDDKPLSNGLWENFICSRSGSVKGKSADLLYLKRLNKVKGKTRLSGTISQVDESAIEEIKGTYKRLAGKTVSITGNGKNIKLKTDENGVYEIYDLPVGKYKVIPEKIIGYRFNDENENFVEVEIQEESLEEADFKYKIDNSISGRLFDTNGIALEKVCLDLVPAKGTKLEDFNLNDCTDEDGKFKFDEIPSGTYIIVVNEENKITAREPFGTFYYPNKTNRDEAIEITSGPIIHLSNLIVIVPKKAETITVKGILLYSDGKPVVDERIYFFQTSDKMRGKYDRADSQTTTDEKGQFKINILKGQKGNLFGSFSTYESEYEKCPKIDKIIKEKGEKHVDIETESKFIEAENDFFDVILMFQFPRCKKAKRN